MKAVDFLLQEVVPPYPGTKGTKSEIPITSEEIKQPIKAARKRTQLSDFQYATSLSLNIHQYEPAVSPAMKRKRPSEESRDERRVRKNRSIPSVPITLCRSASVDSFTARRGEHPLSFTNLPCLY